MIYSFGGNLKRMSKKGLAKGAEGGETAPKNLPSRIIETDTDAKLWLFTNRANLYCLAVESIKESRYRDSGSSINSLLAGMEKEESIICVCTPAKGRLLTVSQSGMVKFTDFSELESRKQKIIACGLKAGDALLLAEAEDQHLPNLLLITKKGMSICFSKEEISLQGKTGKGVGGIKLAPVDLYKSDATKFQVVDDQTIRMPFNALPGLGEAAAQSIVDAREQSPFISIEDLRNRTKISASLIDLLREGGCLGNLPESNQTTLFSF